MRSSRVSRSAKPYKTCTLSVTSHGLVKIIFFNWHHSKLCPFICITRLAEESSYKKKLQQKRMHYNVTRQLELLFLLRLLLYLYKYKTLIIPQNTWSAFALSPCSSNIIPKLWNGSEHFGTKAKKLKWFNAYSSSLWYWYNTSQASWQCWIHYFMNQVSSSECKAQSSTSSSTLHPQWKHFSVWCYHKCIQVCTVI